MQCDVHYLECLEHNGDFSPGSHLFLSKDARCCQMLLYLFRCPLIQHNASVPALRESFVQCLSLLDAQLVAQLCLQLSVLGPLSVVVLLRFVVQLMNLSV